MTTVLQSMGRYAGSIYHIHVFVRACVHAYVYLCAYITTLPFTFLPVALNAGNKATEFNSVWCIIHGNQLNESYRGYRCVPEYLSM